MSGAVEIIVYRIYLFRFLKSLNEVRTYLKHFKTKLPRKVKWRLYYVRI